MTAQPERQRRERGTLCSRCRRETWNHNAICDRCTEAQRPKSSRRVGGVAFRRDSACFECGSRERCDCGTAEHVAAQAAFDVEQAARAREEFASPNERYFGERDGGYWASARPGGEDINDPTTGGTRWRQD